MNKKEELMIQINNNLHRSVPVMLESKICSQNANNSFYDPEKWLYSIDDGKIGYQKIETLDFFQQFPSLQWLILKPIYTNAAKRDLENSPDDMGLRNNLNLREITANGDIFGKILSSTWLPNLAELHLNDSADIDFSGFPNLKKIDLRYCYFTEENLKSIAELPCLETFTAQTVAERYMEHFTDEVIEMFGKCQNLKTFHIITKSNRAGYIKQRLKELLPNADVRVGWGRNY